MDQLGALYISAAADVQNGCLHDPLRVANLVDQLQTIVNKSTVPRKNFLIDTTTNRGDAVVAEASAMKTGIGWVTLQVTEGIHRGVHEWCVRVEDQGETTDGSGLMVGLVPKNFTKYDSFISQGGGWCLSRAGKFYGHWRREDSESESLTFGTGDRVIFLLDYDAAKLVVRVGNKQASGHVSNLTQEVFPAISLHYRHQHVRFEYHIAHDRRDKSLNWMERMALPCAASYMPMGWDQMARLGLDSYLYSPMFAENLAQLHLQRIRRSSLVRLGLERDSFGGSGNSAGSGAVQHRYASREGISVRLTVLRNAFIALHRQARLGPLVAPFLSPNVTPESLRQDVFHASHVLRARLAVGGRASAGAGGGGFDAAMACGSVLLIHLFITVARTPSALAEPLVLSLLDYLLAQPLLALREPSEVSAEGPPPLTSVPPETLQLAADNIAAVIEEQQAQMSAPQRPSLSPPPLPSQQSVARLSSSLSPAPAHSRLSGLLSLLLVLATQRGRVSEMMRACRLLLRAPPHLALAASAAAWLRQCVALPSATTSSTAEAASTSLWPQPPLFNLHRALQSAVTHATTLAVPTRLDAGTQILAVGYSGEMVYVHTRDHLSKWGQHQAPQLVLLESTKEPVQVCVGSAQSSLAITTHAVFLLTNRMRAQGIAVVEYSLSLNVRRVVSLDAAGPLWSGAVPLGIATAPCDAVILLRRRSLVTVGAPRQKSHSAPSSLPSAGASSLELVIFSSSGFPSKPLRKVALLAPEPAVTASFSHCLVLEKNGFVDLGPPLILQGSSGHVTIELLVQLPERTATATTLYRHGDKSTCGEVFLETTVLDGARCVRGGYRHDTRGACVVSSPLSPLSDTQFVHIALVFDGKWRLYLDGTLVAANIQGPHVSLDTPKLNWCIGEECMCAVAGFRAWRVGRTATEIARDYGRLLSGTEPGLVRQLLFGESDGNVVFNFSHVNTSGEAIHLSPEATAPRHAVCVGAFSRPLCDPSQHLWSRTPGVLPAPLSPQCAPMHSWSEPGHVFVLPSGHVALASFIAEDGDVASPYALTSGTALVFFDVQSGVAKPCVTLVPPKTAAQSFLASDPVGRVWGMVEVPADPKSRQDASGGDSGGAPANRSTVLAVTLVAFAERREALSDAATVSELNRPATANVLDVIDVDEANDRKGPAQVATTMAAEDDTAPLTCADAAHHVLRILTAHAVLPIGLRPAALYAPLRDDLCKATVVEVVALLNEHVRVVKSSNARRIVSLREPKGPLVVLCALRVLSRLLKQAAAYRLHPSALDLQSTAADDEHIVLQELAPTCSATMSATDAVTAASAMAPSGSAPSTVRQLLSLLASILNEGATTIPSLVLRAAEGALRQGVNLIFADVDLRANMLQRVLETETAAPLATSPHSSVPRTQHQPHPLAQANVATSVRAVTVVKQALERCFTDIATASALFTVAPPSSAPGPCVTSPPPAAGARRPSLSLSELLEAQQSKLNRVQGLMDAVLGASLQIMGACIADLASPSTLEDVASPTSSPTPPTSAAPLTPLPHLQATRGLDGLEPERRNELQSLSSILGTLQILLLGTCITPREGHASSTTGASGDGYGIGQGAKDAETAYASVPTPFAIHEETDVHHHTALQTYYASLFRAAREGLQLILREKSRSLAAAAPNTAAAAPSTSLGGGGSSPGASPFILLASSHSASFSQSLSTALTPLDSRVGGASAAASAAQRRRGSASDPYAAVAELSFLAAPLHTALTALPYTLTPWNASWFLHELQLLLFLSESAQKLYIGAGGGPGLGWVPYSGAFAAVHDATIFALNWTCVFLTRTTTPVPMPATTKQENVQANADVSVSHVQETKGGSQDEAQWLLSCPFLASGVGTRGSSAFDARASREPEESGHNPTARVAATREQRATRLTLPTPIAHFTFPAATSATPSTPAVTDTKVCLSPRQLDAESLRCSQAERCLAIQRGLDTLGKNAPAALMEVLTDAAVTMLYLSNTRSLHALPNAWLDTQLTQLFTRMIPLRNALLPRFRDRSKTAAASPSSVPTAPSHAPSSVAAWTEELKGRCQFLRTAAHPLEADVLIDPIYQMHITYHRGGASKPSAQTAATASRERWMRAFAGLRERLAWRRQLVCGAEELTLAQAASAVSRILLSEQLTAARLAELQHHATQLALLRHAGLKALRHLLLRVPSSVEYAAFLMYASEGSSPRSSPSPCERANKDTRHRQAVLVGNGVHADLSVRLAPCALRRDLRSALHAVLHRIHLAELATPQDECHIAVHVGTATAYELHRCPTSVLCDALQFAWSTRDLPFLRLSGAIADVFARHGSLFVHTWPTTRRRIAGSFAAGVNPGSRLSSSPVDADSSDAEAFPWPQPPPHTLSLPRASSQPNDTRTAQLREESPTERRHRDKAAQYAAMKQGAIGMVSGPASTHTRQSGSRPSSADDDEELAEGSTLVTTRELNTRRVFRCLQRLGMDCCRALSQGDLQPSDKLCCLHFMAGMLHTLSDELEKCAMCVSGTVGGGPGPSTLPFLPAVVERVEGQVRLVCSVLSSFAGALALSPVVTMGHAGEELGTACATTSYWLLVIADRIDTHVGVKTACVRTATALLARCHPRACDAVFRTVPMADATGNPSLGDGPSGTLPRPALSAHGEAGATLSYLIRYAADLLDCGGVDATAAHVIEGLRGMLASPQWARHLAVTSVSDLFTNSVAPLTEGLDGRVASRFPLLVCICALGGCLLHVPIKGLPCEVYLTSSVALGLSANAYPLTGYLVDMADADGEDNKADPENDGSNPTGHNNEKRGKAKDKESDKGGVATGLACVEVRGTAPAMTELADSLDSVFLPTDSASFARSSSTRAATDATPVSDDEAPSASVCPPWASHERTARIVVEKLLGPAISAFADRVAEDAETVNELLTPTDVACLAALLDLIRQLATSAKMCHALVVCGIMHKVNHLTVCITPRSTLPPAPLMEWAAMAWRRVLNQQRPSSTSAGVSTFQKSSKRRPSGASLIANTASTPPPSRRVTESTVMANGNAHTGGSLTTPDGGRGLVERSALLGTPVNQRIAVPGGSSSDIGTSYLTDLLRVRAQVMGLMGRDGAAVPAPGGLPMRGVGGTGGPATAAHGVRFMVADGSHHIDGSEPGLRQYALRVLCFYAQPHPRPVGTLTISGPTPSQLAALCAPGCTVELSVLLCHRLFVDLGQSCHTQSTWSPNPASVELELIALVGTDGTELVVTFAAGQLRCVVQAREGNTVESSTQDASTASPVVCSLPLSEGDFDHFLHIAVFVEAAGITLSKDGASATTPFPPDSANAQLVKALLGSSSSSSGGGGVRSVVLGHRPRPLSVPRDEVDATHSPSLDATAVLVSAVRVSSGTSLRASVKALADVVTHSRVLPMLEPSDEPCAFTFRNGTDARLVSTSGQYEAELHGLVHRLSLYDGMPSILKDRHEALYTGCSSFLPHRGVDGTATGAAVLPPPTPTPLPSIPRQAVEAYLGTLTPPEQEAHALDQLWSVCAYWSREAVVTALYTCTRPSYPIACREPSTKNSDPVRADGASTDSSPSSFDVFLVLGKTEIVASLLRLLALQNAAEIPVASVRLIQSVVTLALHRTGPDASSGLSAANQKQFLTEFIGSVPSLFSDAHEKITMHVPLGATAATTKPSAGTRPESSVVIPLAVVRSSGGAVLSFDKGKPTAVEQMLVCRDAHLSAVVATYPDAKGGWGGTSLPQDCPYVYLRVSHSQTAAGAAKGGDAMRGALPLAVMIRSWRPVMARAVFSAVCAYARRACVDDHDADVLAAFFRGEVITVLAAACRMGGPLADESTHAAAVLCEFLQTWAVLPRVSVTTRAPLHMLVAPLNEMLVTQLRSRRDGMSLSAARSPTLGTYNVYLQELYGIFAAALVLEAAWRGMTVVQVIRHRWQRMIGLWRHCAVDTARSDSLEIQVMMRPPSGSSPAGTAAAAPLPSGAKLGSGEWDLTIDSSHPGFVCRASSGCADGVFYYEVTVPIDMTRCREFAVGVMSSAWQAQPEAAIEDAVGTNAQSWIFSGTRLCRLHNNVRHDFPTRLRWKPGDVIGILIDVPQRRLVCTQNGRHVSAFDAMNINLSRTSALFPCVAIVAAENTLAEVRGRPSWASGVSVVMARLNCGAAPFSYPPPCDYLAPDLMHYSSTSWCRLWLLAVSAQWAVNHHRRLLQRAKHNKRTSVTQLPCLARVADDDRDEEALLSAAGSCVSTIAAQVAISCAGRSGPMWVRTMSTRRSHAGNGADPATAQPDSADGLVCWDDGAQGFARGTVSVTQGKWYFEVEVLRGAATALSVGWTTTTYQNDGSTVLGEDDHSWVLEGKRMVAKHAGTQRNVNRASWADGDVLGCALDCEAGTIAFNLNGEPLALLTHPSAANTTTTPDAADNRSVIFAGLHDAGHTHAGLTPALYMRGKSVVQLHWGPSELQYTPVDYQPLEGASALWAGVMSHVLLQEDGDAGSDGSAHIPPAPLVPSPRTVTMAALLAKKVAMASAAADINPNALHAYCLDAVSPSVRAGGDAITHTDKDAETAAAYLKTISGVAEVLFPFAHASALPFDVDPADATWTVRGHPLRTALALCRSCCLPYVGLQALHTFLRQTNGPGDGVRLTLNRRNALAVLRDASVPLSDRVQRSLVGQVHSLLRGRDPSLFATSKKLWSVSFSGEGAEDVGGPYRECLSQMTSELMSTDLPFFVPCDNQTSEIGERRDLFIPNAACTSKFDRMVYLFIGRLMAGCLRGSEPLSLFLPSAIWKAFLGDIPDAQDLAQMDLATAQALSYVEARVAQTVGGPDSHSEGEDVRALDEELLAVCPGGFTVTDRDGRTHNLVEGGDHIAVTSRNASRYVELVREWKLRRQYAAQLDALKEGFLQVVPHAAVAYLKWFELEKAVCGQRDYDPDALLDNAQYDSIAPDDPRVLFLRQVLRDFTAHERALFMRFVSGRERLPQGVQLRIQADSEDDTADGHGPSGSGGRRSSSGSTAASAGVATPQRPSEPRTGPSPRRVQGGTSLATSVADSLPLPPPPAPPVSSSAQRLPHASTCFFILTLPRYPTQDVLRDKLRFAIEQCIDMDADFRVRDGIDTDQADGPVLAHVESDDELFEDFTHLH